MRIRSRRGARRACTLRARGASCIAAAVLAWPLGGLAEPIEVAARGAERPAPVELGLFGGVFFPDEAHEFFDWRRTEQEPLRAAGPALGLRLAYAPLRFAAVEAEGDLAPQETRGGENALLYGARLHLVGQLPLGRFTPFALAGAGVMGVRSQRSALADDVDLLAHAGLGAKLSLSRRLLLRVDVRALRGPRAGSDGATTHLAALVGLSFALGGGVEPPPRLVSRPPPTPVAPTPVAPKPVAPKPPPPPTPVAELDPDADGLRGDADRCPFESGPVEEEGCPDADRDRDGVADQVDNCPGELGRGENQGCVAAQLVVITQNRLHVLEPITFTTNRTVLRPRSLPVLDNLAAVILAHPDLGRVRIAGHTDDRGPFEHNRRLSQARADAVAAYLRGRGVAAERLEAIGYGEEQPLEPNTRAAGRAQNRRVEFEIAGAGDVIRAGS